MKNFSLFQIFLCSLFAVFYLQNAHEKMGVVDAQWIEHLVLPSLGNQGESIDGKEPWEGVRILKKKIQNITQFNLLSNHNVL